MEQWTGSKLGKKYDMAVYCHSAYLTYMHSTLCEMLGWMKHKLESRLPGEISTTSDVQMIPTHGRMWKGTKEPLEDGERGEWKSWLKTQHSWNNDHGIQSHHFMQTDGGKVESSNRFSFLGLQTHCGCWLQSWHQDTCFLEGKPWQT